MKQDNINSVMRSIFRYIQLEELNSPSILLETELNILRKRIKTISAEDLVKMFASWTEYYKEQLVKSEIDNEQIMSIVEREIRGLN